MLCIGIDTGVHTGFAVWDSDKKIFYDVDSTTIHEAMLKIKAYRDVYADDLMVRVEDPRLRTWFGTERMTREEERKRLQGVGSVKRDAQIWDNYLKWLGVKYEMVAPKNNMTKLSSESFRNFTGWTKRTNEHGRDAAMIVFGI